MDNFIETRCEFVSLKIGMAETTQPFFCGDKDLDDFFHNDFQPYENELMGKSYCFAQKDDRQIVAAFTVCNGSIHNRLLTSSAKKHLAENVSKEKRNINYPAVLIGRLGVNKERCLQPRRSHKLRPPQRLQLHLQQPRKRKALPQTRERRGRTENPPDVLRLNPHKASELIINNEYSHKMT